MRVVSLIWTGSSAALAAGCVEPEYAEVLDSPRDCTDSEGLSRLSAGGGEARGLTRSLPRTDAMGTCGVIPGGVASADLDGDGWDDLVFNRPAEGPLVVRNDGAGRLDELPVHLAPYDGRQMLGVALVDVSGDGLPELFGMGEGWVALAPNLGGGRFGPWAPVWVQPTWPMICVTTLGFGDLDGDNDLDITIPGLDLVPSEGVRMGNMETGWRGSTDLLLMNRDGVWVEDRPLPRGDGSAGFSLVHTFTDRDLDGDLDLLAWSDRSGEGHPPSAFWRNDGVDAHGRLVLVDDAAEVGAQNQIAAMGHGSHDLNGDLIPDHCASDVSAGVPCLVSHAGMGWVEAGRALGLVPEIREHPDAPTDPDEQIWYEDGTVLWSTWSLALLDLDNDGLLDMAAVAGPPPDLGSVHHSDVPGWQPDWLWAGAPGGGFASVAEETGFDDPAWNYGMVAVDLDRDGHRELVVAGDGRPVEIWENPCGDGAWVDVRLVGVGQNVGSIGARVELETSDGAIQVQEVHAMAAVQQHPLGLHFGLAPGLRARELRARWPDGAEARLKDPGLGELVLRHPAAAGGGAAD